MRFIIHMNTYLTNILLIEINLKCLQSSSRLKYDLHTWYSQGTIRTYPNLLLLHEKDGKLTYK